MMGRQTSASRQTSVSMEAERILRFLAGAPHGISSAERDVVRAIMLQTSGSMLAGGYTYDIVAKPLGGGVYRLFLRERNPSGKKGSGA